MLEGLDKIKWHKLEHAYGPADDVPGLIRDLASDDPERHRNAHYHFYGNLWHQGAVYQATAYAAPFFVEQRQERKSLDS